jgi:hypothetical protein
MGVVKLSTAGIRNYSKTSDFLSGNAPLSLGSFDLLETTTLTTSASSVTFSGLGAYSDYKHLQIRAVVRGSFSLNIRLNGDSGSNYAIHSLQGNGSSVSSSSTTSASNAEFIGSAGGSEDANAFGALVVDFLDAYSGSKNTTMRGLGGKSTSNPRIALNSSLWNNTAAISSMELFGGTWVAGSRFSLIGIK